MIKTDLFSSFNSDLKKEAKRIYEILLKKYDEQVRFDMTFEDIVRTYLKEEYKYYEIDIFFNILSFIPSGLKCDPFHEYVFVTEEEAELRHLTRYISYCIEKRYTNPKEKAFILAKKLVNMSRQDIVGSLGLHQIVVQNMPVLYPNHHDSVDAKSLILCLQDEIENLGYKIEQVNPLIIKKVQNRNSKID